MVSGGRAKVSASQHQGTRDVVSHAWNERLSSLQLLQERCKQVTPQADTPTPARIYSYLRRHSARVPIRIHVHYTCVRIIFVVTD